MDTVETLQQSDEEDLAGEIMVETPSESEKGVGRNPPSDTEILRETSSEKSGCANDGDDKEMPPQKKRRYAKRNGTQLQFLNQDVCLRAHQRLYGVGTKALQNLRESMPAYTMHEKRLQEPKHETLKVSLKRSSLQARWPQLVSFFWMLYVSCAEILPTKFRMPASSLYEQEIGSDPDFQERYTAAFLQNIEKQFELSHGGQSGPGTFEGPRRFLEHAQPIDLYHQYTAFSEAESKKPAGFTTFMRVFKRIFATHLGFRQKGEHAQCNVCFRYKDRIKKAGTKKIKDELLRGYTQHLLSQWLDRQFYWRMRSLSRNFYSGVIALGNKLRMDASVSYLCCIMDGMDQSKLRVPKLGYARMTKTMEQLFRPTLHLAATWLHGWKVFVSIADEDCKKDSECQMEQLARALSTLAASTSKLPLNLHIQTDNCYREGKNRFLLNFGVLLVCCGIFRSIAFGYLRTAHSHEDIDQVFGQLARYLAGRSIASANGMVEFIQKATSRTASQESGPSRLHGSDAFTYKLDEVTAWKEWVSQTGLIFAGVRHVHYIRFCKRADLGADVLDHVSEVEDFRAGSCQAEAEDIFMVSKQWLADTEIQRCVAIMPAATAKSIRIGCHQPGGLAARRPIGAKCAKMSAVGRD